MEQDFYREYYEAEGRHWWFLGRRRIFTAILDRYFSPTRSPAQVLDYGCGTGTMVEHLSRYGESQGVDMSEDAVRFCHQRGLESVRRIEPDSLPFPEESFDLVTALDVIEHIDDDRRALRDLRRVLRPGGTLLVSVPAYRFLWGPQDEISHHKRRYVRKQLGELLVEAGFTLRRLSYFNTFLFPPIAAFRVLRPYRPGSRNLRSDLSLTKPGRLNSVLAAVFAAESRLLERFDLPFGVSILGLATRDGGTPVEAPAPRREATPV